MSTPIVKPLRALIVDDDSSVGLVLGSMLEEFGFAPLFAESYDEAVQVFIESAPFAVAFIDLSLPGKSGLEVIAELRRRAPQLPIVIETGYAAMVEVDARCSPEAGLVWLAKPFTESGLKTALVQAGVTSSEHTRSRAQM